VPLPPLLFKQGGEPDLSFFFVQLENILLTEKENERTVKLSDFGVVGILQEGDKDTDKKASVRGGTRYRPVMVSHVGSVAYMGK